MLKEQVTQQLQQLGPQTGLSTLQALYPEVPRRRLQQVQTDVRQQVARDKAMEMEELTWAQPGTVWAADYTESGVPIDEHCDYILGVRDLASHLQLLALPAEKMTSEQATQAMAWLFKAHGPPLVIKTDNGSPFIAEYLQTKLKDYRVVPLLSPPRTPRYNGAIEAGLGSLKNRIYYQAVSHGRTCNPTSDDVEAARQQANLVLRPWGPHGPTPAESWRSRVSLTDAQREQFIQSVAECRQAILREKSLLFEPTSLRVAASVARDAIRRALELHGYLQVRRRRITPPFTV